MGRRAPRPKRANDERSSGSARIGASPDINNRTGRRFWASSNHGKRSSGGLSETNSSPPDLFDQNVSIVRNENSCSCQKTNDGCNRVLSQGTLKAKRCRSLLRYCSAISGDG
jgi:hypothetical protein